MANFFESKCFNKDLIENLYLYCTQAEAEQIAEQFHAAFQEEFQEITYLPSPSIAQQPEDVFELAGDIPADKAIAELHPYVIQQPFTIEIQQDNEEELDKVSERVFQVVRKSAADLPYFSLLEHGDNPET